MSLSGWGWGCNRSIAVSYLALLLLSYAPSAAADPSEVPSHGDVPWLRWNAPAECPNEKQIEERFSSWLGGAAAPASLNVAAYLSWLDGRWHVNVQVALDGQLGRRELDFDSCADAADFVALAAVLALKPEFGTESPASEVSIPEDPPPADNLPPPEPAAPLVAEKSKPGELPSPRAETPLAKTKRWLPWVELGGSVESGPLPSLGGGLSADLGLTFKRWSASLGFIAYPGTSSLPLQGVAAIHYERAAGRARFCRMFFGPPGELGPCVGLEVGAFRADQAATATTDRGQTVDVWIGGSLTLEGTYTVLPVFKLVGGLGATVPFQAPIFVLDNGEVAHRPSPGPVFYVAFRFAFGRFE